MGERLDSNQQPEAYEAPALPLSYAPEFVHGRDAHATFFKAASWDRTSNLPLTRRLLYPLSYHGAFFNAVSGIRTHLSSLEDWHSAG